MKKSFIIALLFLLVGIDVFASTHSQKAKIAIHKISDEDKQALEDLFRILFIESYCAYTLFGSKPMTHKGAFYDVLEEPSKSETGDYVFLKNWKVWKKYAQKTEFQMSNYVFIEKSFPELFEIHFLSRENILTCVKTHIGIFQEILGDDITPEAVYKSMVNADDVFESLGDSQILYGILFGFGKENAVGYHKKFELNLDIPWPTSFHNEETAPDQLTLPYFSVFGENCETEALRKTYQQERLRILALYSEGNFLEITLEQLLSN